MDDDGGQCAEQADVLGMGGETEIDRLVTQVDAAVAYKVGIGGIQREQLPFD
ncbi:MAG: hypothetical protein LC647_09795 [Beggiatoa sp.]|nr:hypothetical protein [Beggiatoa sp.]